MKGVDLINKAIAAIGHNQDDDYIIAPRQHANILSELAAPLAALLNTEKISFLAVEYERSDQDALSAQGDFMVWSKWSHIALLLSVVFASLLAAMPLLKEFLTPDTLDFALALSSVLAVFCSGAAGVCLNHIRSGNLLAKWMSKRAEAETLRLEYFSEIVEAELPADDKGLKPTLLQLEYFRRYQLDVQLSYYENRGKKHAAASNSALLTGTMIMAGVALISAITGIAGVSVDPSWATLSLLAIVLQAYAAKTSGIEALNQDGRNAERYSRTRKTLARLKANLDPVRTAVCNGKRELLQQFVEAVHEQLSLEHRQWLKEAKFRNSALDRLEQKLKVQTETEIPGP